MRSRVPKTDNASRSGFNQNLTIRESYVEFPSIAALQADFHLNFRVQETWT